MPPLQNLMLMTSLLFGDLTPKLTRQGLIFKLHDQRYFVYHGIVSTSVVKFNRLNILVIWLPMKYNNTACHKPYICFNHIGCIVPYKYRNPRLTRISLTREGIHFNMILI